MVIFDPSVMYTTLFRRAIKLQVPVSLYVLELFLAGSVTVMVLYMKLFYVPLLVCIYFCGQLA